MTISRDALVQVVRNLPYAWGTKIKVSLNLWHYDPTSKAGQSEMVVDERGTMRDTREWVVNRLEDPGSVPCTDVKIQTELFEHDSALNYNKAVDFLEKIIQTEIDLLDKEMPGNQREWGIGSTIVLDAQNLNKSEKAVVSDHLFEVGHTDPVSGSRHLCTVDFKTKDSDFLVEALYANTDMRNRLTVLKTANSWHGYANNDGRTWGQWIGQLLAWDQQVGGGLVDLHWLSYALIRQDAVLRVTDRTKALPVMWEPKAPAGRARRKLSVPRPWS